MLKVTCPHCGEVHEVSVREAYINDAIRNFSEIALAGVGFGAHFGISQRTAFIRRTAQDISARSVLWASVEP
jgi:hypothetical protein